MEPVGRPGGREAVAAGVEQHEAPLRVGGATVRVPGMVDQAHAEGAAAHDVVGTRSGDLDDAKLREAPGEAVVRLRVAVAAALRAGEAGVVPHAERRGAVAGIVEHPREEQHLRVPRAGTRLQDRPRQPARLVCGAGEGVGPLDQVVVDEGVGAAGQLDRLSRQSAPRVIHQILLLRTGRASLRGSV